MKTCPNCHFLVQDEAESCSVCKQVFVAPGGPDGPWLEHPDDPPRDDPNWTPPLPTTGSGVLTAERLQAGTIEVRARRRRRPARIIAWILLPILLLGLGTYGYYRYYGYLPLLPHFGSPIDLPDSAWTTYRGPDGSFSLELPSEPTRETTTVDVGAPERARADIFQTQDPTFAAGVFVTTYPPGVALKVEGGIAAAVDGLRQADGVGEVQVVREVPAATPLGEAVDAELRGTLDGEPAMWLIGMIISGNTAYQMVTIAPVSQASAALDIQNRMVTSFTAPAAPR
jgi:hypothetical protein